jgi:biotin operon repressor
MSAEETSELTEPTLAELADQTLLTEPTSPEPEPKSLVERCKEKLKEKQPQTLQEARSYAKTLSAELGCDRANVYKAARKLADEGFFSSETPPKTETFTVNWGKAQVPPPPAEEDTFELPEEPQTEPPTTSSIYTPSDQPPQAPTQSQQPKQPYVPPKIDDYSRKKVARLIKRLGKMGAQIANDPTVEVPDDEAEDCAEAALLIFANNGVVDPRVLAGLQLLQTTAPRLLKVAPKVLEKTKTLGKPKGAA